METVVQKWGNSLGIRIPALYVKELKLKKGSSVEIIENNGQIIIQPHKVDLETMLSEVTSENIHASVETGTSLGKEEW